MRQVGEFKKSYNFRQQRGGPCIVTVVIQINLFIIYLGIKVLITIVATV